MPDRIQRGPDEPTDDRIEELANAFLEALLAGDEVGQRSRFARRWMPS
jgi:hypothetical protein